VFRISSEDNRHIRFFFFVMARNDVYYPEEKIYVELTLIIDDRSIYLYCLVREKEKKILQNFYFLFIYFVNFICTF